MPVSLRESQRSPSRAIDSFRAVGAWLIFITVFGFSLPAESKSDTAPSPAKHLLQDFGLTKATESSKEPAILVVANFASGCSCSGGAVVDLARAIRGRSLKLVIIEPMAHERKEPMAHKITEPMAQTTQPTKPTTSSLPRLFERALEITKAQTQFDYVGSANSETFAKWKIAKTPEVLVFDQKGRLAYQGAITADPKGEEPPEAFLSPVLDDLEAGRPARWTKREAFGCALPFGPLAR